MDTSNTAGDLECFENRVTSVPAAYRPLGIYAAVGQPRRAAPGRLRRLRDDLRHVRDADRRPRRPARSMATDREIGTGHERPPADARLRHRPGLERPGQPAARRRRLRGGGRAVLDEVRPVVRDDAAGLHRRAPDVPDRSSSASASSRSATRALHASKVAIVAAPMPADGPRVRRHGRLAGRRIAASIPGSTVVAGGRVSFPDLGSDPTGAGDHPTEQAVEVSLDDAVLRGRATGDLDADAGTWCAVDSAASPTARTRSTPGPGWTRRTSAVASSAFTVAPDARVEWQVVRKNAAPSRDGLADRRAASRAGASQFATGSYGNGSWTIVVRLVEDGLEVARSTAAVKLK